MTLVERLRGVAGMDLRTGGFLAHTMDTAKEAADEIERLRAAATQVLARANSLQNTETHIECLRQLACIDSILRGVGVTLEQSAPHRCLVCGGRHNIGNPCPGEARK